MKKLKIKIPLLDFLNLDYEIQEGQILYIQNINLDKQLVYVEMLPIIYLGMSKKNNMIKYQLKDEYMNNSNKGKGSVPINCIFIEVEAKI